MTLEIRYILTIIEQIEKSTISKVYTGDKSFILDNGKIISIVYSKSSKNRFQQINANIIDEIEKGNGTFYFVHDINGNKYIYSIPFHKINIILNNDGRFLFYYNVEELMSHKQSLHIHASKQSYTIGYLKMIFDGKEIIAQDFSEKEELIQNETKENNGFVYVIDNPCIKDNPIKIGKTKKNDIKERLSALNTSVPMDFRVLATLKSNVTDELEKNIHKVVDNFTKSRLNPKREFFYVNPTKVLLFLIEQSKIIHGSECIITEYGKKYLDKKNESLTEK